MTAQVRAANPFTLTSGVTVRGSSARMNSNQGAVVVSGVDIPFLDLVGLLIKLALASIPATVILGIIFFGVGLMMTAVFGGIGMLAR